MYIHKYKLTKLNTNIIPINIFILHHLLKNTIIIFYKPIINKNLKLTYYYGYTLIRCHECIIILIKIKNNILHIIIPIIEA